MRRAVWAALSVVMAAAVRLGGQPAAVAVAPSTMQRTGTVDERFQSYNVEMIELTGGRFWKPYADIGNTPASAGGRAAAGPGADLYEYRPPIDLTNPRLRKLAAALGPAYMRISGTWANSVYFHDSDTPAPKTPPDGFNGVLTRQQWKNAIDFSHAVGGEIVTSFAFSPGTRNANDEWIPDQARRFVAFTKSAGGKIAAAEFMNEPNYAAQGGAPKGYDAAMYGRDVQAFAKFFHESLPRSLFVGPGSTGEGGVLGSLPTPGKLQTEDLLKATGPAFDVFSYHIYAAVSQRCAAAMPAIGTTEAAALTRDWLLAPLKIHAFYAALRDRYLPGKPMWVTEVADAGCGGNPWASTFRDTFRYVNQMGMLARKGVKMIAHNTLASSDYGLLDEKTFTPRPNYWAAVLWQRLMGQIVLDPGATADGDLYVYAQCMRDSRGGVTFMAINPGNSTRELQTPMPGERYTLTAKELGSATVELNGRALEAKADGTLPAMQGSKVGAGQLELAPASITFLTFPKAGNKACQ